MNLRIYNVLLIFFITSYLTGQKVGVVLDSKTKNPIEFVDVYNNFDHTITNTDGSFFILASWDSISFRKIGYEPLRLAVKNVQDSVFLNPKALELEGITLTNIKSLWDKVRDSVSSNYLLKPYKERFFLRCILRKNGEIIRLQDISGKLSRRTMLYKKGMDASEKDFQFEIENMRKIGVVKDENNVNFNFFSLSQLLFESIRLNATGEGFTITEKQFKTEPYSRISIKSDSTQPRIETEGDYIINNANNAIESIDLSSYFDIDNYRRNGKVEQRPLSRIQSAIFTKSKVQGKYFITLAKLLFEIEIKSTKNDFVDIYKSEYILHTMDNNEDFSFKANTNGQKDIFKLKHEYNQSFWDSQNTLPLTKEMIEFIENFETKKKEFRIRQNFH
ncbi:carboxypeptidase-like regulatory domain-containing protein [Croceivirga thetidis]|uniref:Carboxypeptidase-like regulatory domain-containing protein n=1 Tax=Croceivirga thetidis TaxID=2721623 RepID=A0ABX1GL00_9FLAO|nr:carboxypeptidase-like regulatory domain-containing protein [Croceivirga thetidis]NKI30314.1 carboxypeptidase-like regulatory domain-containing protein [Croceivirga thetidis]